MFGLLFMLVGLVSQSLLLGTNETFPRKTSVERF